MRNLLLALLLALPGPANASAIAAASDGAVTITLYNEKCTLPGVSNLPLRITWRDASGLQEGCFGVNSGLVLAYFADRSVVAIPAAVFKPVTGA